jgi:hypothetical protein
MGVAVHVDDWRAPAFVGPDSEVLTAIVGVAGAGGAGGATRLTSDSIAHACRVTV